MARHDEDELLTVREKFEDLTVDVLKPLAALVGVPPGRKGELVEGLTRYLADPGRVRALYEGLDETARAAVREAVHDPGGVLREQRFRAKYGRWPNFGGSGRSYGGDRKPTSLQLFFPGYTKVLATDLWDTLRAFVPEPEPLTVQALGELPPRVRLPHVHLGAYHRPPREEEVEPRVRPTARAAEHDVMAVLRLVDAGAVKVGDKTRRPAQGSVAAVAGVLAGGDFYGEGDRAEYRDDPGHDLAIAAFAWPLLVQAGGLAAAAGGRLQLTVAGRKAPGRPAAEVIRGLWEKWQKTNLLDEFSRVSAIKGQQSKGRGMTAVAGRREAVAGVLRECPVGKWVAADEFFRLAKVLAGDFAVSHSPWKLYVSMLQYGSFGDGDNWGLLQGRYVLALLFEYAATLGLVDVAYVPPSGARNDFRSHWGTDDYGCLSRYDGLHYLRLNPLGAWYLGLAGEYRAEAVEVPRVFQVLPNLDVVAPGRAPGAADVLFLERFAERASEAVWRLSRGKVLAAAGQGRPVGELREFLQARSQGPLPQTVEVMLADLEARAGALEDLGAARLVACRDEVVARTLAGDRRLRGLCQLAGERHLVFRAADEAAVRRALRELGYVLPPPG